MTGRLTPDGTRDFAVGQKTLNIQEALDLGNQHHNAGDLQTAESIYNQILQADPNQPDALHYLGVIAYQAGNNKKSIELITKALTLKPDYAEAHSNLGLSFQELGRLDEAVLSYRKAIGFKPNYTEAHYNLGIAYQELNKPVDAIYHYRQTISATPDYFNAYSNLGIVLRELGQLEEAEACCRNAIKLKPDFAEAHNNLGILLHDLGENESAVTSIKKAISLKENFAEAHSNLGAALQGLGEYDDAINSIQKALAINPNYAEAYNNLGKVSEDLGKLDEAVASYQRALVLKQDFVEARCNLAVVLKSLGKLEEALEIFETVETPLGYAMLLECLFALGKYDRFYEEQEASGARYSRNIRAAAISVFASQQLGRRDPHQFCPSPFDFIEVYENLGGINDSEGFLKDLIVDLKDREGIWEPPGKTTKNGFQTSPNLFNSPTGLLLDLEQIIKDRIEDYRLKFSSEDCIFARFLPKEISLIGWFVRLLKEGHQASHIHPSGWLSGVLYLQLPSNSPAKEGAIKFGLWGYDYPILDNNYPEKEYYPKSGDIILFPSSLFHRTIPFHSDEERMSIAFDLIPNRADVRG